MERKKRRNKSRSEKSIYLAGAAGILLLVILAFFGPQLVFAMQDTYQTGKTWQGTRKGPDMEAIYSTYGGLRDRMAAFAERLEQNYEFYVAGTEYHVTTELLDLLDVIVAQEGYEKLVECGIAPYLEAVKNRGYTLDQWMKYVIYSDITDEETNAVVISGWYIAFTTRDQITVKMLVDTETYELYYMKIVDYKYTERKNKEYWEWLYADDYFLKQEWLAYWFDYYEAGQTEIQTFDGYVQGLWLNSQTDANEDKVLNSVLSLPYGEYYLDWQFRIRTGTEKGIPAVFSIGLEEVAELIPQLKED